MIGGTIAGSFHDPVFLIFLAIAAGIGFNRMGLVWMLPFIVLAATFRHFIAVSNREALGLPPSSVPWLTPTSTVIALLLVWALARAIRWLFKSPTSSGA
jgi:hypothetical protein